MEIKNKYSLFFLNCFLFARNQFGKIMVLSVFSTEAGWVILKQKGGPSIPEPKNSLGSFCRRWVTKWKWEQANGPGKRLMSSPSKWSVGVSSCGSRYIISWWCFMMIMDGTWHNFSSHSPHQQKHLGHNSPRYGLHGEAGREGLKTERELKSQERTERSLHSAPVMLHLSLESHGWRYCTHFADGNTEIRHLPKAAPWDSVYQTPGPGLFFLACQPDDRGRGGGRRESVGGKHKAAFTHIL